MSYCTLCRCGSRDRLDKAVCVICDLGGNVSLRDHCERLGMCDIGRNKGTCSVILDSRAGRVSCGLGNSDPDVGKCGNDGNGLALIDF